LQSQAENGKRRPSGKDRRSKKVRRGEKLKLKLRGAATAAVEVPLSAGTAARVAAAIITEVVGAAVVTSDAHRLASNVAASGIGAEAEVDTLASPAAIGNSRGRAGFTLWWKCVTEDVAITLAGVNGFAGAINFADAVWRAGFLIALGTLKLERWAVDRNAVAIANRKVRFAIAIAGRWKANVGCVAGLIAIAVLVAVAAFTLRAFTVARNKVARHTLGFGESIRVR
tara:strand:- start:34344 stop:35024 length:681 start_codon:yes stop_codon:yes gene_type:complete